MNIETKTVKSESGFDIEYDVMHGKEPYVMFVHGTYANKGAIKAKELQETARKTGHGFVALTAHCHSNEEINDPEKKSYRKDFRVSGVAKDIEAVAKDVKKDLAVVASSMGFWGLTLALPKIKNQVKSILGLSVAPDHHNQVNYIANNDQLKQMFNVSVHEDGTVSAPIGKDVYYYTPEYLADCKANSVLGKPVDFNGQVVLMHGENDPLIQKEVVYGMAKSFPTEVEINIIPKGVHDMNGENEKALMNAYVIGMVNNSKTLTRNDIVKAQVALQILQNAKA